MGKDKSKFNLFEFASIAGLNLIVPIISLAQIVLVIRISGLDIWSQMVVGVAFGGIAQSLIDRGYSISGSRLVGKQKNLYFLAVDSLRHRTIIFFITCVSAMLFFFFMFKGAFWVTSIAFLTLAFSGMTLDWLLIAAKKSSELFVSSTLVRFLAFCVGIIAYLYSKNLYTLLAVNCAGSIVNVILGLKMLNSGINDYSKRFRVTISFDDFLLKLTSDVNWLMAIPLISIFSPALGPLMALVDKTIKFLLLFLQTFTQFLTGYVISDKSRTRKLLYVSIRVHFALATLSFFLILTSLPAILSIISNEQFRSDFLTTIAVAFFAFFVILMRPLVVHFFVQQQLLRIPIVLNFVVIGLNFVVFTQLDLSLSEFFVYIACVQVSAFFILFFAYQRVRDRLIDFLG